MELTSVKISMNRENFPCLDSLKIDGVELKNKASSLTLDIPHKGIPTLTVTMVVDELDIDGYVKPLGSFQMQKVGE